MKKLCNAHTAKTKQQCNKRTIWGSKYCWHHQDRTTIFISFVIGLITSVIIPQLINFVFPSMDPQILSRIEDQTAPNELSFGRYEVVAKDNRYLVSIFFTKSRDIPLGTIHFKVSIDSNSSSKILNITPLCSLVTKLNTNISHAGKEAMIEFSDAANEPPVIQIELSKLCAVLIEGNHGLITKKVELNI